MLKEGGRTGVRQAALMQPTAQSQLHFPHVKTICRENNVMRPSSMTDGHKFIVEGHGLLAVQRLMQLVLLLKAAYSAGWLAHPQVLP